MASQHYAEGDNSPSKLSVLRLFDVDYFTPEFNLTWLKLVSSLSSLPISPFDQVSQLRRQRDRRDSLMPTNIDPHLPEAA